MLGGRGGGRYEPTSTFRAKSSPFSAHHSMRQLKATSNQWTIQWLFVAVFSIDVLMYWNYIQERFEEFYNIHPFSGVLY